MTYYNKILHYVLDTNVKNKFILTFSVNSETSCILYTSKLVFDRISNILSIASGTVFNYIVFWEIQIDEETKFSEQIDTLESLDLQEVREKNEEKHFYRDGRVVFSPFFITPTVN